MRKLPVLIHLAVLPILLGFNHGAAWSTEKAKAPVVEKRPLVAMVGIKTCAVCARVRTTLGALKQKYAGRVDFQELDVSDDASTAVARKQAQKLGVLEFLKENEEYFPVVAVFSAGRRKIDEMAKARKADDYESAIKRALAAK